MEFNDNSESSIDLGLFTGMVRRSSTLIVLTTVLFLLLGYLISVSLQPLYEASTVLLVSQNSSQVNEYNAILSSERQARTYSQILVAKPIISALKERLGLTEEIDEIARTISANPISNTQLMEVRVQNTDSTRAALLANTLVELFIEAIAGLQQAQFADSKATLLEQITEQQSYVDQIQAGLDALEPIEENEFERSRLEQLLSQYRQSYTQLLQSYEEVRIAEAQSTSNIVQIEPAFPPVAPIRPNVFLNTTLAGITGLILTVGFIVLREAFDNSIKTGESVKIKLGIPVIALIGKNSDDTSLVAAISPRSPISESFRSLRTNIQFASVDKQLRTIMVTSAVQGEGKTTVAANLAYVMSQLGTETVLIDADLRRPRLHRLFEVSNKKGLSNLFVNKEIGKAFASQLQNTKYTNLKVLASGGIPPNPSELISTVRMMNILELASANAGLVIVDAPPVLPVTDAVVLAQKADGVIIVMVPGQTTMPMAKQMVESLHQVNAKIIGAVFNNVDLTSAYFASYRNGYRYLYDHES